MRSDETSALCFPAGRFRPQRGAALVIVLSILVLLTALLVAFMTSARNDLSATQQYALGQEALALSETATNLVMAQIREATLAGIDNQGRGTHAWASQPGALRVWNNQGNPASPYVYKLYSAARMKEDSMGFLASEIPEAWRSQPDSFTDLNEPVNRGANWRYPILDPAALGRVEGFSTTQIDDTAIPWDTRTSMPVRWIYVSRDGTMSNTLQPTSVGRVAFWTDDETSKVNVNTASFSELSPSARNANNVSCSFWDTPTTRMAQDYTLGRSLPIQDEFQRYPGHPASVNLGSVLKLNPGFTLQQAFSLLPRYKWGGSLNGTRTWTQSPDVLNDPANRIGGAYRKLERLYASVDELYFQQDRSQQANYPQMQDLSNSAQTDLYRFFITSSSRAPDVTMFGGPRVCLWPLHRNDDDRHRTVFDNLIARCATLGPAAAAKTFYFQRYDALSQTNDWLNITRNRQIFSYLQEQTGRLIPGFGGRSFQAKYDSFDGGAPGEWAQILTQIFDYIRCVNLNETLPGLPANFVRYTPELRPPDWEIGSDETLSGPWLSASANNPPAGAGFVLPIRIDSLNTRGMGRVPTLSELGVLMLADYPRPVEPDPSDPKNLDRLYSFLLLESTTPMMGYMPWVPPLNFSIRVTGSTRQILVGTDEVTIPAPAFASIDLSDPINPQLVSQPWFPNIDLGATVTGYANPYYTSHSVGGTVGVSWMTPTSGRFSNSNLSFGVGGSPYPFFLPVNQGQIFPGTEVDLIGSTLTVEYGLGGVPFQTIEVEIPSSSFPKPEAIEATAVNRRGFNSGINGYQWWPEYDVTRSVLLRDGDPRIAACLQDVPKGFFEPHPDFDDTTNRSAHSFTRRRFYSHKGSTFGSLISSDPNSATPGLVYPTADENYGDSTIATASVPHYDASYYPDISPSITDLRLQKGWTGDWSTGVGNLRDGGYTIKSDEGFARGGSQPNYFNEYYWSAGTGFFSPVRQIPSAVLFGTLPTGVKRTLRAYTTGSPSTAAPWRTLLFCPNPDAGPAHAGFAAPADYLLLDFFNMPVVEPYAISEPLSTAGRINMNSQILPFTELRRDSGLHAVLSSKKVTAISPDKVEWYKTHEVNAGTGTTQSRVDQDLVRFRINVEETLKQFHERFAPGGNASGGDIFRSAAEICSVYLIPNLSLTATGVSGPTLASSGIQWNGTSLSVPSMQQWWQNYRLTGDNLRERPYATLYPLLTTKSNTYTVHVRSQTLVPGTNRVTAEYRGSTTIERYVDPADGRIGSGVDQIDPDTQSLEPLYRFRVIDTKRFAP